MTQKTVRALATLAAVALLVAACGGGSSDDESGDDASDEATEEPADGGDDGAEDIDVEDLDFAGALFTIEDFEGFVPGDYVAGDEGSTAGSQLRGLCGQGQLGPESVAGELLELQDAETTLSFTTSVDAFASEDEAREAFATSADVAFSCDDFTSNGDVFGVATPLDIAGSGDESFDLFAVKTDTGLLVGDHFVRVGQFVFDVRIVLSQGSVFSRETLGTLATAAVEKFLDWVEETTG